MTKTMLSSDMMLAYNQLLANMAKPVLLDPVPGEYQSCYLCGATFSDAKSLAKHELSHNQTKRKHECKECLKRFNSSSDLKRHSLIHTNTRPYKCHLCPTAFVQQAHLTRHLKSHTRHGVRFKCLGCGTMFLHSTNVRWHQQFCEEAQGSNGGYVVTQSEGEGLDSVPVKKVTPDIKPSPVSSWTRENKIYYFDGPFSNSRHSSSSDTETSSSSTDGGSEGSTSFLNSNKLVYFDGPYDKSELLVRNKARVEHRFNKPPNQLSASQLSYLNSRVSMIAPKPLKHIPTSRDATMTTRDVTMATRDVNAPSSTEDLLKLLATLQDGERQREPQGLSRNLAPFLANIQADKMSQKAASYKIVPNKIIQHNVTPPRNHVQTSPHHGTSPLDRMKQEFNMTSPLNMTSQHNMTSPHNMTSQHHMTSPDSTTQNQEDKIKSILDLVKKLVAEGLQSPTAEIILNAISRHLGNMSDGSHRTSGHHGDVSHLTPGHHGDVSSSPYKKRKLSEPAQNMLHHNMMATQSILANNLTPLLQSHLSNQKVCREGPMQQSFTPLSFTPLMFRQFPSFTPASSSLLSQFSKPSSLFASQLLNLANKQTLVNQREVPRDVVTPNQSPAAMSRDCSPAPYQLLESEARKPADPPMEGASEASRDAPVSRPRDCDAEARDSPLSSVVVKEEPMEEDGSGPAQCDATSGHTDTSEGHTDTSEGHTDTSEGHTDTSEGHTDSVKSDPECRGSELQSNMDTCKNIAFHRLQDLLSLV